MEVTLKKLIADIRCGRIASPVFTEEDLAAVKACLPEPVAPIPTQVSAEVQTPESCVNQGIEEVKRIMLEQLQKQPLAIELSVIKGKLQEVQDHYRIISVHYRERYRFFNDTITELSPFTSEFLYWQDEANRLLLLESKTYSESVNSIGTSPVIVAMLNLIKKESDPNFLKIFSGNFEGLSKFFSEQAIVALNSSAEYLNYSQARAARIKAQESQLLSKAGATRALKQRLESIPSLGQADQVQSEISAITNTVSGQLIPIFSDSDEVRPQTGLVVSARSFAYEVRIIDLDFAKVAIPQIKADGTTEEIEKIVNSRNSPYLSNSPFSNTIGTGIVSATFDPLLPLQTAYELVPGALYNETAGYPGLYRKISSPIRYLYTLEERGLTFDPNNIDPLLAEISDSPKSITEQDTTFYIANQEQYSKFYTEPKESVDDRIQRERDVVFPNQIAPILEILKTYGQREAADFFRRTVNSEVRLARPLTYKAAGSNFYRAGEFEYSQLDDVVSERLAYYTKAADQVDQKIQVLQDNIDAITKLIADSSMNEEVLSKKISEIDCFKKPAAAVKGCEAETQKKLGKDPLMIRTLAGTDSSLPDMNNPCYWKAFADSLSKINLLPIPDINSPTFRYYPISCFLPSPAGIVLIPLPQRWKTLFTLSTPIGTLVGFLTLPAIPVGIPLPSIYLFYFSPDGSKYLLLAPNLPLLLSPGATKYGFEIDSSSESDNPIGLSNSNPNKGQPIKGSLSIPIKLAASSSKAARLAAFAADQAQGQKPAIKSPDGRVIKEIDPQFYLQNYLGKFEASALAVDGGAAEEFVSIVEKFKADLNSQFKILGDMQISAITELKAKTRNSRQTGVINAEEIEDPRERLKAKDKARAIDPVSLNDKVQSLLSDFEAYIDKVNLGTISIPKDPTRLNPKLPSAVTAIQPLVEKASRGEIAPDLKSKNLTSIIKKFSAQVDPDRLDFPKKSFDLTKDSDINEFKSAIKKFASDAIAHATGEKTTNEDIDPNLPEERRAEIAKANELRKSRIKAAFALSSLSIKPPSLKLFDPSAPCCAVTVDQPNDLPSPQVLAAIAVFNSLFDAVLSGLTIDSLKALLGDSITNVGISAVKSIFDTTISAFPEITIPELPDVVSIFKTVILPILSAINIPQAPIPLGAIFPVPIKIPLNEIIKPLLKAAVAYLLELLLRLLSDAGNLLQFSGVSLESPTLEEILKQVPCGDSEFATVSTTNISKTVSVKLPNGISLTLPKIPNIPLDIFSYFALLTSTDLMELIRGLIFAALDGILEPLKKIVVPILNIATSFKDLSLNIIEVANPFILPIKLITLALQLKIPNSSKIKIADLNAIELIKASYLPVVKATEPVLKETAYLLAILGPALAGKTGIKAARIVANPFVNQDDLPPWERLTHKNPLFAIFLDEIAWRGSLLSTGSLVFQTKVPGIFSGAKTVTSDLGIH